jgi:hypothetical protein
MSALKQALLAVVAPMVERIGSLEARVQMLTNALQQQQMLSEAPVAAGVAAGQPAAQGPPQAAAGVALTVAKGVAPGMWELCAGEGVFLILVVVNTCMARGPWPRGCQWRLWMTMTHSVCPSRASRTT